MPPLNPIRYSDIVKPDDSIRQAVSELTQLKGVYEEMLASIAGQSSAFKAKLQPVSGAIKEQRDIIKLTAEEVDNLFVSYKDISQQVVDVDAKIKILSAGLDNVTKLTKAQSAARVAAAKAELAEAKVQTEIAKKNLLNSKAASEAAKVRTEASKQVTEASKRETEVTKQLNNETTRKIQIDRQANAEAKQKKSVISQEEAAQAKLNNIQQSSFGNVLMLMQQAKEAKKIKELDVIAVNNNADSYEHLSAVYNLNKINLNKYSQEVINSSKFLQAQQLESKHLYSEMSRLQEATGKHTLQVGNYRRAWNGLSVATSQVVRELPAAAVSMNTFFLAISNNIPILIDEIDNLRAANKALQAEGKATVSVGKQMIKALFSFNTVMVLVLTVFAMFGKDILKFVGDLFKGEQAIKKINGTGLGLVYTAEAMRKSLNGSEYQQAVESINKMTTALKNAKGSHEQEKKAIDAYNTSLGVTFGKATSVDGALKLIGDNESAYIEAMKNMTFANVFFAQSAEDAVKIMDVSLKSQKQVLNEAGKDGEKLISRYFDLDKKIKDAQAKNAKGFIDDGKLGTGLSVMLDQAILWRKTAQTEITKIEQGERNRQIGLISKHNKKAEGLAKEYYSNYADIVKANQWTTDLTYKEPGKTQAEKDQEERERKLNEEKAFNEANLKVLKEYNTSVEDLQEDSILRQKVALENTYTEEVDALMNKYNNEYKLTEESRNLILDIIFNKRLELDDKLADLDLQSQARRLSTEKESLELELDAMQEGSNDYYAKKAQIIENARKQAIIKNKMQITAERQNEADINAVFDKQLVELLTRKSDEAFAQYQEKQESEFNIFKRTEEEKTRFKLQQERIRYARSLELGISGAKALSQIELDTLKNLIAGIDKELKALDTDNFDIYKALGLKLDNDQKKAISETVGIIKDNFSEIFRAQQELAQKAVDTANAEVDAKKSNLQDEIDAKKNGYASNVSLAEKELQESKKAQAKALKEQQKYQKAQELIDTATQASSLITASANIWKAFSPLGPLGTALSIAAIAAMFGSFAIAKVKASQASNQQDKTYGEGGSELLDGGSHDSGNDIDLGRMRNGRRRRAEGGEMLAIINRRNTRKYRSTLPSIIDSLNKGVFEQKFALSTGTAQMHVENNVINLQAIESEVQTIRKQGERRRITEIGGYSYEVYKNLTRITR